MDNGTNSNSWGTVTNANLGTALEQAIVGRADISMSSTTVTLSYTDTNAAQDARAIYLNLSGSPGGAATLVVPAIQKPYIVKNGSDAQVTIKVSGQTGVIVPVGKTVLVYNNGTDVVTSVDHIPSLTLASALPVASGGTGITAFGTGVATALGVNVGSAGAVVVNGGALGTPSSGTLTSCTGLPVSTGIAGLGTDVATALAVNVGSAGAVVVNGGALGTPSSGTLTSCTGLPVSTGISGLGTGVATFLATPTSANLAAAVTGETGTGALVFATSPTLVTPTLGAAIATSINGLVLNRGTGSGVSQSVAIGGTALSSATSGTENTAAGYGALRSVTSGQQNVAVGQEAGKDLTTGSKNIYIGRAANASSGSVEKEYVFCYDKIGKGGDTAFIGGSNGVYNEGNTTAWQTTSDQRLKKNIVDNADGLAKIEAIRVRNFEYRKSEEVVGLPANAAIDKTGVQLGVIAQEMLPECVSETSLGVLSVNTDPLVWYLVNAVKELSAQVKNLQEKLNQQNF